MRCQPQSAQHNGSFKGIFEYGKTKTFTAGKNHPQQLGDQDITVSADNTIKVTIGDDNNSYTIEGTNSNLTGNSSVCRYDSTQGSISWVNATADQNKD